jgi:hypothetical protein
LVNGKIWQGEICNRAKDGSLYWVATTIAPKLNRYGIPEGYIALRTDITQTKQHELHLAKKNALLQETQKLGQVGPGNSIFMKAFWKAPRRYIVFLK